MSRSRRTPRQSLDQSAAQALDELVQGQREHTEAVKAGSKSSSRVGFISILLGLVTLAVTIVGVVITVQVKAGVEDLSSLGNQQLVNRLLTGMDVGQLTTLLDAEPVVDSIEHEESDLAGSTIRRLVFNLPDRGMIVSALADSNNEVVLFAVTVTDNSLRLEFPDSNTGNYALAGFHGNGSTTDRFETGATPLRDIIANCADGVNDFGAGASWGYFAVGCRGAGYNNFDMNIVAVNYWGSKAYQIGLDPFTAGAGTPSLTEQLESGDLTPEFESVVFNTFAWGEGWDFLKTGDQTSDYFPRFVEDFEVGPRRGEPISSSEE